MKSLIKLIGYTICRCNVSLVSMWAYFQGLNPIHGTETRSWLQAETYSTTVGPGIFRWQTGGRVRSTRKAPLNYALAS
jgi:hypothetical protein